MFVISGMYFAGFPCCPETPGPEGLALFRLPPVRCFKLFFCTGNTTGTSWRFGNPSASTPANRLHYSCSLNLPSLPPPPDHMIVQLCFFFEVLLHVVLFSVSRRIVFDSQVVLIQALYMYVTAQAYSHNLFHHMDVSSQSLLP